MNWHGIRPRLVLVLEDGLVADVTQAELVFALNAIPTLMLTLPLGQDPRTGTVSATGAVLERVRAGETRLELRAQFTLDPASQGLHDRLALPAGETVIFQGHSVAAATMRTRAQAAVQLTCQHRLGKLAQGSLFSSVSHPGNPSRFSAGALFPPLAGGGGLGGQWGAHELGREHLTADNVRRDLWGLAIYPWLSAFAEADGFWVEEQNRGIDGPNRLLAEGLGLLAPGRAIPAALRDDLGSATWIADAIAQDLAMALTMVDQAAQQSPWEMLIGRILPSYGLALVPRALDAWIVPYLPTLAASPYRALPRDEVFQVDAQHGSQRPLRAVGILARVGSAGGGGQVADLGGQAGGGAVDAQGGGGLQATSNLGGWFDTGHPDGVVVIGRAPAWLQAEAPIAVRDPFRPGVAGPTAFRPGLPRPAPRYTTGPSTVLNRFAQLRYAQETLAGSHRVIQGPPRFDLAPGSLVAFETTGALGGPEDRIEIGQVLRVRLLLDAAGAAAQSQLHLGFVRDAAAVGDPRYGRASHPLYDDQFLGAGLLE